MQFYFNDQLFLLGSVGVKNFVSQPVDHVSTGSN